MEAVPEWFASDDSGLPAISDMVEGSEPEAYKKSLEDAGFSKAVAPKPDVPEGPFRQLAEPREREVWHGWYSRIVQRADYTGEVPAEVAGKLSELVQRKTYEEVFLRVARNGEVLVLGASGSGQDRKEYLVVRWNPSGDEVSSFGKLQQQHKRRTRMYAIGAAAMVLWSFLMMFLFLTGKIDSATYPTILPLYVVFVGYFTIYRNRH